MKGLKDPYQQKLARDEGELLGDLLQNTHHKIVVAGKGKPKTSRPGTPKKLSLSKAPLKPRKSTVSKVSVDN